MDPWAGFMEARLSGGVEVVEQEGEELRSFSLVAVGGVAKGARAFFVPGSPEHPYWDTAHDPLWRAVSETGCVVSFHRNHGGRPRADETVQLDVPGMNVGGIAVRFFSAVTPLTYMIFTGVFERFRGLLALSQDDSGSQQ